MIYILIEKYKIWSSVFNIKIYMKNIILFLLGYANKRIAMITCQRMVKRMGEWNTG